MRILRLRFGPRLGFAARAAAMLIALPFMALAPIAFAPGPVFAGLFDSVRTSPQRQAVPARHLVSFPPGYRPGTIIVQFSQRRLYYVLPQQRAISYPIASPKAGKAWSGETYVSEKRVNPSWRPTAEMRRENPSLPAYVPGGHPQNPLGVRALYLGKSLYRIHGTDSPWSVGQAVSQGCIRMYNRDVADLYHRASVGTRVVVIW